MQQNGWQQLRDTLVSEFSDLPDVAQTTRVLLRLTLAALLGGLLGIEREQKGQAAGVRTHAHAGGHGRGVVCAAVAAGRLAGR